MPVNYKLYPPDWFTRIVPLVRKRSGGKCEQCGLLQHQIVYSVQAAYRRGRKLVYRREWVTIEPTGLKFKPVKVILTVAHLDHDSHNFLVKIDRLLDLCQKCHLRMDSKMKAQKKRNQPETLRV